MGRWRRWKVKRLYVRGLFRQIRATHKIIINIKYIMIVTTVDKKGVVLEMVLLLLNASLVMLTFLGNVIVDGSVEDENGKTVDDRSRNGFDIGDANEFDDVDCNEVDGGEGEEVNDGSKGDDGVDGDAVDVGVVDGDGVDVGVVDGDVVDVSVVDCDAVDG